MNGFNIKTIDKGITFDIVKKGLRLDKTGVTTWLTEKSLLEQNESLLSFEELTPWTRTGSETYSTTFSFTTNVTINYLIAKAIVTLNPEKSLLDWTRRRSILLANNIPVSKWYWTGEATIIETFYDKLYFEAANFEDLIKIAFSLDVLGFNTLKFLDDIRCDVDGNPFYIDFGFDLGEPSNTFSKTARDYLIKSYPDKESEIKKFYSSK